MDLIDHLTRRLSFRTCGDLSGGPESGAYALVLLILYPLSIRYSKYCGAVAPPGIYLYAGRASENLSNRLIRHQKNKNIHWHIDTFTSHQDVLFKNILILPNQPKRKCEIVRACRQLYKAQLPLLGFGSSDFKARCLSHLLKN
tara:strand:- start:404 stop:832 length:429 start_codon:yes stop_codon:yes gene_type:complete